MLYELILMWQCDGRASYRGAYAPKMLLLQAASTPSHFIALIIIYYDRNAKIIDQLLSSIIMQCVQYSAVWCAAVHSVHMYTLYTLYTPPVALPSSQLVLGLSTDNISQHEGWKLRKSLKSTETSLKIRACSSDCDINAEKVVRFLFLFSRLWWVLAGLDIVFIFRLTRINSQSHLKSR